MTTEIPRLAWFRRPWALEAVGAVVVLIAVIAVVTAGLFRSEERSSAQSTEPLQLTVVKPTASVPFDRAFDWNDVRGATSYRVAIFTEDGQRTFEVRDLKTTSVALSPAVSLPPGRYLWQVTALRDAEAIAESPRIAFEMK